MLNRITPLIIVFLLACPNAIAQSTRPDSNSKGKTKEVDSETKGILAGPEVEIKSQEQNQIRFDGSTAGRGGRGRIVVPPRRWFGLLRTIKLSQSQEIVIQPIVQSLQKAAREHNQKHGKKIRQLQRQVQQSRRTDRAIPREVRQELGKLRAKRPKAETYQKQIWQLLTLNQQEQMRKSLAEIRLQIIKQRESANSDRRPADNQTDKDKKSDKKDK